MTSHGFGNAVILSGKVSHRVIADIAKEISRVKPIRMSHVVKHVVCDEEVGYDMIFIEFGRLSEHKPPMTSMDLLNRLKEIARERGHRIANSTDFWIIQESYKDGSKLKHSHLQEE